MFGRSFNLFRLFGFQVKADMSWLLLGLLISWTLAAGIFPEQHSGYTAATYWAMGISGAIGLFASIVLHEFAHSVAARHYGIPMKGITLFIFGGVAEMGEESPHPKAEFVVAIAGPVASVAIGLACLAASLLMRVGGVVLPPVATLGYLALINFVLVIFNMIPAFPLDGGRVLRSILWKLKGDLTWATRVTSRIGSFFGMLLIVLGAFSFIGGQLITGIWWFLLGMFLRRAATMSYQQLLLRNVLEGEKVSRFMHPDPVTVQPHETIHELIEHYVYRYHHKTYPVVDADGYLSGMVTLADAKSVPREAWETTRISQLTQRCTETNSIAADAEAMDALARMRSSRNSRLLVTSNGQLEGILTLKDLLEFISLKMELSGE